MPVLSALCCNDFPATVLSHNDRLKTRQGINDNAPAVDAAPFLKLGTKVPLNNTEASQLARKVTDNLKITLKVRWRRP